MTKLADLFTDEFKEWFDREYSNRPSPGYGLASATAFHAGIEYERNRGGSNSIARSIRDAVLAEPMQYLGDVESCLLDDTFLTSMEIQYGTPGLTFTLQWKTYALIVAEALES
jgi:hypothetical protein